MKVMLLKNKKIGETLEIPKGKPFLVRPMQITNLLGNIVHYFQIIDINSPFSGELIMAKDCIECADLPIEKTFTEKEWNEIENEYLKELEKVQMENEKLKAAIKEKVELKVAVHSLPNLDVDPKKLEQLLKKAMKI